MIDPVAAIIAYLALDADLRTLVADRIAARHKYGVATTDFDAWENGAASLVVRATGGEAPDDQAGQLRLRVECLSYGDDSTIAAAVAQRVRTIGQSFTRSAVELPDGQTALIYWFGAIDSPEHDRDLDLQNSDGDRLDVVRIPFRLAVADTAV